MAYLTTTRGSLVFVADHLAPGTEMRVHSILSEHRRKAGSEEPSVTDESEVRIDSGEGPFQMCPDELSSVQQALEEHRREHVYLGPAEPGALEQMNTLQRLQRFAERERALVQIFHKPGEGWSLMSEFGQEAPDSPMAGGAIYGADEDVTACIEQGLADAGFGPDGRRV